MSTILFPLMFYCFFGLAMAPHEGTTPMARYLIATYGAFAIMGSTLYAFGVGIAVERRARVAGSETLQPDAAGSVLFAKGAVAMAFGAIVILMLFHNGRGFQARAHGADAVAR